MAPDRCRVRPSEWCSKMPGIIDSFFVQVGLDASQFTIGQREADQAWTKTKDQTVAAAKQIEENTRRLAESFDTLKRQALEFFAVIMGASSIQSFIANVTDANNELAVLSSNLQMQPQIISEWGAAIKEIGGDPTAAMTTFANVSTNLFRLWRQGKMLPVEFMQLQGAVKDLPGMGNFKIDPSNAEALAESLAKAAAAMDKAGHRGDAFQFLTQGGIDPKMATVMIDHGADIQKYLQSLKQFAPTDAQLKNSQDLTKSWADLTLNATALGRAIEDPLTKNLTPYLDGLSHWIGLNKDLIAQDVDGWITKQAGGLAGFVVQLNALASVMDKLRHGVLTDKQLTPSWFPSGQTNAPGKIASGIWGFIESLGNIDNIAPQRGPNELSPAGKLWQWLFPPAKGDELTPEQLAGGVRSQPRRPITPTPVPASAFGAMPTMGDFQQGKLDVDGRPVSRGNPMPVSIANWAEGMANSFLGGPIGSGTPLSPFGSGAGGRGGERWPGSRRGTDPGNIRLPSQGGTGHGQAGFGLYATDIGLAANKSLPPDVRAFLDTIGTGETPRGSYSNPDFDPGGLGGRYQFLKSSWATEARKAGVDPSDFSALNQDKVAAFYADEVIKQKTGKSLSDLLKGGPEGVRRAISALSPGVWNGIGNVDRDKAGHSGGVALYFSKLKDELGARVAASRERPTPPHTPTPHHGAAAATPAAGAHPASSKESRLWNGTGGGGLPRPASLSTIAANSHVTTNSFSPAVHVGGVQVNAPNATDSKGIADSIADALQLSLHASLADYGQA